MKRLLALVLITGLLCGFSVPESSAPDARKFLEEGYELVQTMAEMSRNDFYLSLAGGKNGEIGEIIQKIGAGNYDAPSGAFLFEIPSREVIQKLADPEHPELSDRLQDVVARRLFGGLAQQFTARSGVSYLAASALLGADSAFLSDGISGLRMLLIFFDGGTPALITFFPRQDGIVTATGFFFFPPDAVLSQPDSFPSMAQEFFQDVLQLPDFQVRQLL